MSEHEERARGFGAEAEAYHRGRPSYGDDAVAWALADLEKLPPAARATDRAPLQVLELGAGTGLLTQQLVALGHSVLAVDPDERMLTHLRHRLPDVTAEAGSAEDIPAPARSFDVVVVASAFHWFDREKALPEIARVLRPGGRLVTLRHERDTRIPWVRRLGRFLAPPQAQAHDHDVVGPLTASDLFDEVEDATFQHWQTVDRASILDLARSRSHVALMGEEEREALLRDLLAFYDDYGRGMDGMQLPYRTEVVRSVVVPQPEPVATPPAAPENPTAARTTAVRDVVHAPVSAADDVDPTTDPTTEPTVPLRIDTVRTPDDAFTPDRLRDSASDLPAIVLGDASDDGSLLLIDFR
ncbi:MAG: SAM-dependent methyltransferase [Nocardioides sp.]|nr:SAM-dependent methyltransferase [Nocardioides sp.]